MTEGFQRPGGGGTRRELPDPSRGPHASRADGPRWPPASAIFAPPEENFLGGARDPLGDHAFLYATKARTELLPPALTAAGLPGLPYTRYHEIAALMKPEEVHPEVVEKLDAIMRAFRL